MRDDDLEFEFQRMLAERAEDVSPSPAPYRALTQRIAVRRKQQRNRVVGAVVATAVTVVGVGAFAASSRQKTGGAPPAGTPTVSRGAKPFVPGTGTRFAYDDGTTTFARGGVASSSAALSGYVGYMRQAATDYLAKADVRLPDGDYTIVTTFNHQMMEDAKQAADQGLWKNTSLGGKWDPAKHPADRNVHLAFSAVDPRTGQVKAFYSGVDGVEDYTVNPFNAALYGGIQVGSTFKAFTLATALETGRYSADSQEPSTNQGFRTLYRGSDAGAGSCVPTNPAGDADCLPMTYVDRHGNKQSWPPSEDDEAGGANGIVTLRTGFEQSLNSVFADLEMEPDVTPRAVEQMAAKLGIDPSRMTVSPALTLGASAITPMRMANAYAAFANGGIYHDPVMVTEIINTDTKQVVWRAPDAAAGTRVMQQTTAAAVTDVMKGVLTKGTASSNLDVSALVKQFPNLGGKTGTTDYGYSAWFNGYSDTLSTAVGLYRQDTSQTLLPLQGLESSDPTKRVNGNSFPTSVWAAFMAKHG